MGDQTDEFFGATDGSELVAVTTSDTDVQSIRFRALHNATSSGGTIAITDQENRAVTIYLAAGQVFICRPRLIKSTGTTVATIVGIIK